MRPLRILWVKVGGLWPLHTGGRLRSFHILSELARLHRVTLMTTHGPGERPDDLAGRLPQCERVTSFPCAAPKLGSVGFARAVAGSWLSPLPVDLWKWQVPGVREAVRQMFAAGEGALCGADFPYTTPDRPLPGTGPPVLLAHHPETRLVQRLRPAAA